MKQHKEPLVHIVILHWNNFKDTSECVKSLNKVTYSNYKIVVVDNGSTDDSTDKLHHLGVDTVLATEKNLGFSGGNNVGIKYALNNHADFVLLLNNDTFVDKNFLSHLVHAFEDNPKTGITSPKIYYASNPEVIWATGAYENKKSRFGYIDSGFQKKDKGQFNDILNVDCVWGCCMLISADVFHKVGFLDDNYFLYYEDADFCYRTKQKGFDVLFVPQGKIWHRISQSSGGEDTHVKDYYNTRNSIFFVKKNITGFKKYQSLLFIGIDSSIQILINLAKLKSQKTISIVKGLYTGYSGSLS